MKLCLLVFHLSVCLIAGTAAPADSQTWVHFGLPGKTVNSIAVDPSNSDVLFAGAEEGLYRTTNSGASWDTLEPGLMRGIKAVSIDARDSQVVYAVHGIGDSDDGVYRSTDAGMNWNRIYGLVYGTSFGTYTSSLYAGALDDSGGGGVHVSTDGGATWDTINQGLTNLDVLSLAGIHCFGDSLDMDVAGTRGGIFRRTYLDTSWVWVGPASNAHISDFCFGEYLIDLYAAWGNGSWSDGVYKSTDMGESWIVKYYYIYTHTVTVNPLNRLCVYAGALGGGVFRSTDNGENWNEMNQGLTDLDVRELTFSPTDTTWLYAGTEGSGIFRCGVGLGTEETTHGQQPMAGLRLEPNCPNPFHRWTVIRYQLPVPGRVTVRVFDVAGTKVRSLVDAKVAAGHHECRWNGLDGKDKEVPSGVYFYRLSSEGQSVTRKMVVVR